MNDDGSSQLCVALMRYASAPKSEKTDYSKSTPISDHDEYKVTVTERVVTEDGNGGNMVITKQITDIDPAGEETIHSVQSVSDMKSTKSNPSTTDKSEIASTSWTESALREHIDSGVVSPRMYTLNVVIDGGETLTFNGISPSSTMRFLRTELSRLKHCTFYDRDGYEVPNPNTTLETVAERKDDEHLFVLNARITWTHQQV